MNALSSAFTVWWSMTSTKGTKDPRWITALHLGLMGPLGWWFAEAVDHERWFRLGWILAAILVGHLVVTCLALWSYHRRLARRYHERYELTP